MKKEEINIPSSLIHKEQLYSIPVLLLTDSKHRVDNKTILALTTFTCIKIDQK